MNSESLLDDAADAARCLWCWFWRCEHEVVARAEDWVMKECERCSDRYKEYKNQ